MKAFLVASAECAAVFKVERSGKASLFAGTGVPPREPTTTGGPARATDVKLNGPTGLAMAPDGTVFIADYAVIRRVSTHGSLQTVQLRPRFLPGELAVTTEGALLATDYRNGLIWRVNPDTGKATPVAGQRSGSKELEGPVGIAPTPTGGFLVADVDANHVWRVEDGSLTNVAGTGTAGYSGDGGLPSDARLGLPSAVALTRNNGTLISDAGNDRVRLIPPGFGRFIKTVAGSGRPRGPFPVVIFPQCSFEGCGGTGYDPLWNYFYLTGRPITASAGHRFKVHFVTTRRARVRLDVTHGSKRVRRVRDTVAAGRRAVRVAGLSEGRYRLHLVGKSGDETREDRASLSVH
jgi:hypothetical protein